MKYQESIFIIPCTSNLDDIHKTVMNYYSQGKLNFVRDYIYSWKRISDINLAIILRQDEIPPHLNPMDKELELSEGTVLTIQMSINTIKRFNKRAIPLRPSEVDSFINTKLTRAGFKLHEIIFKDNYLVKTDKKGARFSRNITTFTASVSVIDSTMAEHSFMKGIGRGKSDGFGTILLRDENDITY